MFLLSNNATLAREAFYQKILAVFKKTISEAEYDQILRLFKMDHCYNAGFVLAHELSNDADVPKDSKLLVLATQGTIQELKNHGFNDLETFEDQ